MSTTIQYQYTTNPDDFKFKNKPSIWPTMNLSQKVTWSLRHMNKHFGPYVDKIVAKQIVQEMCPEIKTAPIIRILKSWNDVTEADLNPNWMIKGAHGCKFNVLIEPKLLVEDVKLKLKRWNVKYKPQIECQYDFVEPRFFIEEKIDALPDGKDGKAMTVILRCFHGQPATISFGHGGRRNHFDLNMNPMSEAHIPYPIPKPRPETIKKIIEYSKILSKPFEFVRVDFYVGRDPEETIWFSEFTFSPNAGSPTYTPDIDLEMGKLWT
jgi:hypothetical protein